MTADPESTPPSEKTGDLLELARAADEQALNQLFARHVPDLKRWASGRHRIDADP